MDCDIQNVPGRGPHIFKAHGQICYQVGSALPQPNVIPSYGQLFFVDESVAADHRIAHKANRNCSQDLMKFLSAFIRQHHEYANAFKLLSEVYKEEEEKARLQNRQMEEVKLVYKTDSTPDPRRYNAPRVAEVALIYVGPNGDLPSPRSYTIHMRHGGLKKIPIYSKMLDPCTYPLYFIRGDFGYHLDRIKNIKGTNGTTVQKKLTQLDYYNYYLSIRRSFSPIHFGRRLFQQFVVGCWANVEQCRLEWIKNNQTTLRAENYIDLMNFVADGADGQCGRRLVLPATHASSPRNMIAHYMDAMAITSRYGKPDIFLTFTCNPKWREIQENLHPGQTATDRPDLIARVFRMKVKELKQDVIDRGLFGKVTAYIYTVEWQKRGLPHIHMLITLADEDKPKTPIDVDRLIKAELPDIDGPNASFTLFDRVVCHMIHRDCTMGSPCWKDGKCSKSFPKQFQAVTSMDNDGYPSYSRRNNGIKARIGTGDKAKYYENGWVVPYSPYLLLKYDAHINVEVCSVVQAVKYLFKYVYKGVDRAQIKLRKERRQLNGGLIDEVEEYLDARYLCPPEGFHRLFSFNLHGESNVVVELVVHEEDRHTVVFAPGQAQNAANREGKSTLLGFFAFNKMSEDLERAGKLADLPKDPRTKLPVDPRTIPYHQYPEYFTFIQKLGKWQEKKLTNNNIGRIHSTTPKQRERYCIRQLLINTTGATSYQSLFTVNDIQFPNAFEAAKELGLIQTTDHFNQAMKDADAFQMPHGLRCVFVTLLAFDEPSNAQEMWNEWKVKMSEDFVRRGRTAIDAEALAYYHIFDMCAAQNIDLTMLLVDRYTKPTPMNNDTPDYRALGQEMYGKLNSKQKEAVDAVISGNEKLVFLDGPGGSGKTFCYECVYNQLKGDGKKVICVAWTGIAANLLPEGRTIASFFKMNIAQNCESSSLKPNSADGKLMKETEIFVIDECSMLSDRMINTMDKVLRDVMDNPTVPFGGKTILMGGDFRQILPIGNGTDGFSCCLKQSPLFGQFKKFELLENMRANGESNDFKEFLLKVGDDRLEKDKEGKVEIPGEMISKSDLIGEVFEAVSSNMNELSGRAILCPKNYHVDLMNKAILEKMNGKVKVFVGVDKIEKQGEDDIFSLTDEYMATLTPSGLPPHRLELKIGAIVMLIRNLNVREGLCNGTRLQVQEFARTNAIKCAFINGVRKGQSVIIPRIDLFSTAKSQLGSFI